MRFYRFLTDIGASAISFYLQRRLAHGREDAARFAERLGQAAHARPKGKLIWCHAASVGEAMSVLSLIKILREQYPDQNLLLTTGTVTSSRLLATRLPAGVIHQYIPVDRWPYVTQFLDHWKPDLALWVESELWPNILAAMQERTIPAVLLNGRMSEKSFRQWSWVKGWIAKLLSVFQLGLAQTEADRERFAALGLKNTKYIGNLKYAAEPLAYDDAALTELKTTTNGRHIWLMASTHKGEDEIAMQAHQKLRERWPDLLTVIVPRHPTRGEAITEIAMSQQITCALRSEQKSIATDIGVYVADTMGELGLFYRLCPVVCLGGSFVWGGHNPVEPARLGSAMIFGPRMTNFTEIAEELVREDAAVQIQKPELLAEALGGLLENPTAAKALAIVARGIAEKKQRVLQDTLQILKPYIEGKKK